MEFEIVWNGRRDGRNRGYLLVDADEPIPPPMEPDRLDILRGAVELVLTEQWTSVRAIAIALSWPRQHVQTALLALIALKVAERHVTEHGPRRKRMVFYRRVVRLEST